MTDLGVRVAPAPKPGDVVQILCDESVARSIEAAFLHPRRARLAPPVLFGEDETPTYIIEPEGTYEP